MNDIKAYDFRELVALFQATADKLAAEGLTPDQIAYSFAKYAKQKANQQKAREKKKEV